MAAKEYTIKELADLFGVSKQAVMYQAKKRLSAKDRYQKTINGNRSFVVTPSGYKLLKQHYKGSKESNNVGANVGANVGSEQLNAVIQVLKNQLQEKDKQMAEKDRQIAEAHKLADQAQHLQLTAESKLKELQQPQMPHTTSVDVSSSKQDNSPREPVKRHWWQIFK